MLDSSVFPLNQIVVAGGASSFEDLAAAGSWEVAVVNAGHMAFLDWDGAGPDQFTVQCPLTEPPEAVLPDVLHAVIAFTEHRVRATDPSAFIQWSESSTAAQRLKLRIKPASEDLQIATAG